MENRSCKQYEFFGYSERGNRRNADSWVFMDSKNYTKCSHGEIKVGYQNQPNFHESHHIMLSFM